MYDILIGIVILLISLGLGVLVYKVLKLKSLRKVIGGILAFLIFLAISGYILLQVVNSRTRQYGGNMIHGVITDQKVVALTFDDGPTEEFTPKVVNILQQYGAKGTFFLIGENISKYTGSIALLNNAGFQIGNHSYYHNRMVFMTQNAIRTEIEKTNELIRNLGYTGNIYFRSPNGKKLIDLPMVIAEMKTKNIFWTIEPETYPSLTDTPEKLTKYVLDRVQPGGVILLHPNYEDGENTRQALPMILSGLQAKGYKMLTIDELLKNGTIY